MFNLDSEMVTNGLAGYNGCLVGCAFSAFLGTPVAVTASATMAGASASALLVVPLKAMMGSVPQWTLSFNVVTLTALTYLKPLQGIQLGLGLGSGLHTPSPFKAPIDLPSHSCPCHYPNYSRC